MKEVSKSPSRNTFLRDAYIKRRTKEGKLNAPETKQMINWYNSLNEQDEKNLVDPEWQKNNMEYDLRSTDWILEKVRSSDTYAQNLYAAMCNNDFVKVGEKEVWGCSWRSAGGIIADMRMQGDYIDWYCSGMGDGLGNGDEKGDKGYVPESYVTEEIEEDLLNLGWTILENEK
jgi:hypothetical protein